MTPDVSVLVAASRADHPHHAVAPDWLEAALSASDAGAVFTLMPMALASPKIFQWGLSGRLLVVIDPQRAFVDPEGSLMRAHGPGEVRPGVEAFGRVRAHLAQQHMAAPHDAAGIVFVRSEYRPGQFTGGRLDDPMAHVCVPGVSIDCEWAAGLDQAWAGAVVTKHQADAGETGAYRDVLARAVAAGVRHVVLAGRIAGRCRGQAAKHAGLSRCDRV
jgi:nicotinamidase-related amidase